MMSCPMILWFMMPNIVNENQISKYPVINRMTWVNIVTIHFCVFTWSGSDDEWRGLIDRARAVNKDNGTVKEKEKRRMKRTKCPSALLAEADGSSKGGKKQVTYFVFLYTWIYMFARFYLIKNILGQNYCSRNLNPIKFLFQRKKSKN